MTHRKPKPAGWWCAAIAAGALGCATPEATDRAAEVAALAEEAWEYTLARSPFLQAKQGLLVREIHDLTPEQAAIDVEWAEAMLDRLQAIPHDSLTHEDLLTLSILEWDMTRFLEEAPHYWLTFPVTPYTVGFTLNFLHQAMATHPFETVEHVDNYQTLLHEYADSIEQRAAHIRGQMERGIYLPQAALPGVVGLFRSFRDRAEAVFSVVPERTSALPAETQATLPGLVQEVVAQRIVPAYTELLELLESDAYATHAPVAVGLAQYPEGDAYYRLLVTRYTTDEEVSPEELHELGQRRVAELATEMEAIRRELGFEGDQQAFHADLRTDPRFLAQTPEEVEARFAGYIARMEPIVPELFSSSPRAPYGVRRLDPAAEGSMTFGYYQPPTPQEPQGLYRYNGSQLDQRSLIFAGPLIFHELVPGHHFHLASQSENRSLPTYRREYLGAGAFNEGWGNYAAFLGREQGLLDDPYDRYGWAIFDMFISARLVVDTGMNLLGWSLEEGREFMRRHTFQSDTEIATESIRYSTDLHGQALGYKWGLEKLLEMRRWAEQTAGDEFTLPAFHEAVLGSGAMPLDILETHVQWHFTDRPSGHSMNAEEPTADSAAH